MANPALADVLRQVEAEKSAEPWYAPYDTPSDKVAADTMRAGGPRWTPTGEILRGAYFPPAPAPAQPAQSEVAPEAAPAAEATPEGPALLGGVTATAPDALSQHLAATEAARRKAEETARGRAGAMGAAVEAVGKPPVLPPPPKSPTLPPAPDVGLRAFMTPGEKASASEVLRNFVGLLGTTMGAFGGASRHAAAGSLSALTGAMKGWMEGDRERVTRELERWRIDSERLLKQHELELSEYNSILKNAELSWDHKVKLLTLTGVQWDNQVFADSLTAQDQTQSLKEFEDRWFKAEQLKLMHRTVDEKMAEFEARMLGSTVEALDAHAQTKYKKHYGDLSAPEKDEVQKDIAGRKAAATVQAQAIEPEKGFWVDTKTQRFVTPTKGEMEREPGRFAQSDARELQLATRIEHQSIPAIKRMFEIIPQLLTREPAANLVNAGMLALQGKTSANPKLREFENLVHSLNIELSTVLSGGVPRIAILRLLEAGIGLSTRDNQGPAYAALSNIYAEVENTRRGMFRQPGLDTLHTLMPGHWVIRHGGRLEDLRVSGEPFGLDATDEIVDFKGWK